MAAKSSAKHPFLPMFVGDFMAATAEWEGEEQALYGLLLMHQWALGHLPAEVTKLARLVKWDPRNFERYWPIVKGKFEMRQVRGFGARLLNARLEEHRGKSLAISEKRAAVGGLGARARWQKDGNSHAESAVANATPADGNSHDFANGKRNAIHPIPSHPDPSQVLPPSPQDSRVITPEPPAGITRAKGHGNGAHSADPLTARIQAAYPEGTFRASNWTLGEREIRKRVEEGEAPEQLVEAAEKYCEQQRAKNSIGTQFVLSPEKFFGPDGHWRGPFPLPQASGPKPRRLKSATEIAEEYEARELASSGGSA